MEYIKIREYKIFKVSLDLSSSVIYLISFFRLYLLLIFVFGHPYLQQLHAAC